jgi:hypothetical protein
MTESIAELAAQQQYPLNLLLDLVEWNLRRFIVYTDEHCSVANTLWIAATHTMITNPYATRLRFVSPQKECGKTTAQDVTSELCQGSMSAVNISAAALARTIATGPPTMHLDEYQSMIGKNAVQTDSSDLLQGIFNAGFQRGKPYLRWNQREGELEECPTFAMISLAGVGALPDMVASRCIDIMLIRKLPGESIEYYRGHHIPGLQRVRDLLHMSVSYHYPQLLNTPDNRPEMPVDGRDADKWESLIRIADVAGGRWPERSREACKVLCVADSDSYEDLGRQALLDIRRVFVAAGWPLALPSRWLQQQLLSLPESVWEDYGRGRALTQNKLARLLKPYKIFSTTIRFDPDPLKGYYRASFEESWARYLTIEET